MKELSGGLGDQIKKYLDRARLVDGYINRVIYPTYQRRQRKRYQTEGASEGVKWPALNAQYAAYKLKKFSSYPGGGRKMMIATGRMKDSVIGPGADHRKIGPSRGRLEVYWTTPYAVYTEDVRPVNVWDKKQDQDMYRGAAEYIMNASIKSVMG